MSALDDHAARYRPLVAAEMRRAVGERPEALYAWMRYHLGWEDRSGAAVHASPGKMMRPVGTLLVTELLGGSIEAALPVAASIELIHNFSLLHDDVEDASEFRRGRENLWTFAGAAQAINTGDGMFVVARLAQYRMAEAGVPPSRVLAVMREVDDACLRLVHGQYLDMSFETRRDVTAEEYLEMAGGKTAALFAASFAVGAILADADEEAVTAFRTYGLHLGLAFQMVDDVLGIWGDTQVTGKPVGDDISSRKMTYPVIVALAAGDEAATLLAEAYARPPAPADRVDDMARWIDVAGGREATERRAREEQHRALAALDRVGVNAAGLTLLTEYAEAAVGRVT